MPGKFAFFKQDKNIKADKTKAKEILQKEHNQNEEKEVNSSIVKGRKGNRVRDYGTFPREETSTFKL